MLERAEFHLEGEQGDIEERAGHGSAAEDSTLVEMQAAHAQQNHGFAGLDADGAAALLVFVGKRTLSAARMLLMPRRCGPTR